MSSIGARQRPLQNPYTSSSNIVYTAEFLSPGEESQIGDPNKYTQAGVDAYFQQNKPYREVKAEAERLQNIQLKQQLDAAEEARVAQARYEDQNAWWKPLVGTIGGLLLGGPFGATAALTGGMLGAQLVPGLINYAERNKKY